MLTFTVLAAVEKNVKSCPWHGNASPGCQQNMFFQLFVHECLNVVAETRLFRQLFFRRSSKHMSWSMRRQLVMLVCSTVTVSDRFSSGWSLRVMAHGWDNLLKEVEGLHEFIEAQKAVCEKSQIQAMLESHASQISRRTLQCSAEGAKAFTALVSKGPWSDAQKASLGSWCGEQLLNSSPGSRTKARRETQTVASFAHYFSEKDCATLGDKETTLSTKLECLWTAFGFS